MRLDEAELVAWGERVGRSVSPPVFLGLSGPLGAGKSLLARAVGRGVGVREPMPSPTYNLVFRYRGRGDVEVVHLDLYRIEDPAELAELGWWELGRPGEIVLVEWPERAGPALPPDRWRVELSTPPGRGSLRDVSVRAVGRPRPLGVPPGAGAIPDVADP